MDAGYIKLHRSLLKWEWYDDVNVKLLFIHLLLSANFTEGKWHGVSVAPGQLITSNDRLCKETGLTSEKLKTALKKLTRTGEIIIKTTNKYTLITIEKYIFFQSCNTDSNKQTTNEQQSNNYQETNEQQSSNKQTNIKQITNNNNIRKKERKERKEGEEGEEGEEGIYQQIADLYNATCVSFPKCTKLSQARKDALKARLKFYSVEDFKQMFEIAEKSDFLKGANSRNWQANFDWMISDKNMPKILEGNYLNKPVPEISKQEYTSSANPFFNILKGEGIT